MSQQSQLLHSANHAGSRWIIAAPAIVNRLARVRLYARTRTVQGTHGSTVRAFWLRSHTIATMRFYSTVLQ